MASIERIKASDGSGNASMATVQNIRSPGASTIVVDTVVGIPDEFMGSMGTPHTFTDPVTGETITVISEDTAVDFSGHVDGSNLEIDDIAAGYVDGGSAVGDIVVIRPTTQWGDNVADVLAEAHNDDGSLKDDAVTTDVIADDAVTTDKIDDAAVTYEKWRNTVRFSARRDAALTPSGTAQVTFDAEDYDPSNSYNTSTGRFTAPVTGDYQFNVIANSGTPNRLLVFLYKNGSQMVRTQDYFSGVGSQSSSMFSCHLTAGDYVEVYMNTSSNALSVGAGEKNYFQGHLISL